ERVSELRDRLELDSVDLGEAKESGAVRVLVGLNQEVVADRARTPQRKSVVGHAAEVEAPNPEVLDEELEGGEEVFARELGREHDTELARAMGRQEVLEHAHRVADRHRTRHRALALDPRIEQPTLVNLPVGPTPVVTHPPLVD